MVTTYLYDEQGRVSRVVQSSPWTTEDRTLMLAWSEYQAGLCPGCGHPKATAWHHLNDGSSTELEGEFVCQTCTAAQPRGEDGKAPDPKTYPAVVDHRDYDADPLPGAPEPQIL